MFNPQQKAKIQALVAARNQHGGLFDMAASEKPPLCWKSVEAYREEIARALEADAPWNELRDKMLNVLDTWLLANKDAKQIKVQSKSGRFRTFCQCLLALQGNFGDLLRDLCEKAQIDYRSALRSGKGAAQ